MWFLARDKSFHYGMDYRFTSGASGAGDIPDAGLLPQTIFVKACHIIVISTKN